MARGKPDVILKQGESEDECNLFLLGMDSEFVASTHNNNLAVGKMTLGRALTSVKFKQSLLRQKSGCVIGIAPVPQVGEKLVMLLKPIGVIILVLVTICSGVHCCFK